MIHTALLRQLLGRPLYYSYNSLQLSIQALECVEASFARDSTVYCCRIQLLQEGRVPLVWPHSIQAPGLPQEVSFARNINSYNAIIVLLQSCPRTDHPGHLNGKYSERLRERAATIDHLLRGERSEQAGGVSLELYNARASPPHPPTLAERGPHRRQK